MAGSDYYVRKLALHEKSMESQRTAAAVLLAGWQELLRKKTSIEQEKDGIARTAASHSTALQQHCSSNAVAQQDQCCSIAANQ